MPRQFLRDAGTQAATPTERRALNAIRNGPITRADLARSLDVSSMSASRIAETLIARGLVREVGRIGQGKGPSIGLALEPDAAFSAGIAIMTDTISIVLMNFQGERIAEHTQFQADMSQAVVLEQIGERLNAMIDKRLPSPDRLFGIGLAITGYFVGEGSQVNPPPPLDDWALVDLERLIEDRFERPVWVENDGSAAAVGELLYGVGRRYSSFAYLYFAAGFGGGVVVNGELMRGRLGNAGEYASLIDDQVVRPRLDDLRKLVCEHDEPIANIYELVERFDPTWRGVRVWLDEIDHGLNRVVWACSGVLDPDAIVLGGRLPKPLAAMLVDRIAYRDRPRRGRTLPKADVVFAETPGEATAIGAAAVPFREMLFQ